VAWEDAAQVAHLLSGIGRAARAKGAVALMLEPQLAEDPARTGQLRGLGFVPSPMTIQPPRTIVVDLTEEDQAILAAMKSKTRYNIRLAGRRGVRVREAGSADLPAFTQLMGATGARDEFAIHDPAYYAAAFELFEPKGWVRLLVAEVDDQPVAGVMVFAVPPNAVYLYGASGDAHREKMPNYLLQWRAIEWAKSLGCTAYDLWGVPDEELETLEEQFSRRRDGLWGVYRFKRGFGGRLVRSVGSWDRPFAPVRYRVYRMLIWAQRRMLAGRGRGHAIPA
jgi:lipid II:glycine glycyltransferase (peptidoglycan interpeptide bridge formation enzyme)